MMLSKQKPHWKTFSNHFAFSIMLFIPQLRIKITLPNHQFISQQELNYMNKLEW